MLNHFFLAVILNNITENTRGGLLKKILYADDLVPLGDSWEKVKKVMQEGFVSKVKRTCYKMYIKSAMNYKAECKEFNGVHSNNNVLNDMWQDTEGESKK